MKLQQATRLALYAVLELAADPECQIPAADIAEKYGVSLNHLAKVLRDLGRAGLVEAVRGAGGGYRFCGNPRRITLMDVIELFESIGPAVSGTETLGPETGVGRAIGVVLGEIDEITRATLSSITIDTMLKVIGRETRRGAAGGGLALSGS